LDKIKKKEKDLPDAKSATRALQDKFNDLDGELQDLKDKQNNLKKEIGTLKNDKNQAIRDKDKALTELQNVKDTLEAQIKSLEDNKFNLPTPDQSKFEEHLQQQFGAKLAKALQDRENQYNHLKAQNDDMARKMMDDIRQRHEKEIQALNNDIDEQKKELAGLQNDLLKRTQERDRLKRELDNEKPLRTTAEDELKKQKEHAKEELKRAKDKCDQLQKEYGQMCEDHFNLEKVNLDLRTEIETLKKKIGRI